MSEPPIKAEKGVKSFMINECGMHGDRPGKNGETPSVESIESSPRTEVEVDNSSRKVDAAPYSMEAVRDIKRSIEAALSGYSRLSPA